MKTKGETPLIGPIIMLMIFVIIGVAVVIPVIQTQIMGNQKTYSTAEYNIPTITTTNVTQLGHVDLVGITSVYNNTYNAVNTVIDEVNRTVLTSSVPTWMTLEHYPVDSGSDAIMEQNSTSGINYTLTRNVNYTINYVTGVVNFTVAITGSEMASFSNYTYTTIAGGQLVDIGNYTVNLATGKIHWNVQPGTITMVNVSYSYYDTGYIHDPVLITLLSVVPLLLVIIIILAVIGLLGVKK
jgi:hypothetical protein